MLERRLSIGDPNSNSQSSNMVYLDYSALVSGVLARQLSHLREILWFAWMESPTADHSNGTISLRNIPDLFKDSKLLRLFLLSLDPELPASTQNVQKESSAGSVGCDDAASSSSQQPPAQSAENPTENVNRSRRPSQDDAFLHEVIQACKGAGQYQRFREDTPPTQAEMTPTHYPASMTITFFTLLTRFLKK